MIKVKILPALIAVSIGLLGLLPGTAASASPTVQAPGVATQPAPTPSGSASTSTGVKPMNCNPCSGLMRIIDRETARCLDSNAAGKVYTLPCNGGGYQYWSQDSTNLHVVNYATGRCLAAGSGGNVYTWPCQAGNLDQYWTIITPPPAFRTWGTEYNTCLDSNYAGDVYALGCNGGSYQYWNS